MKEQFPLTNGQEILYPGVRAPNQSRHSADGSGLEKVIYMAESQDQGETPKIIIPGQEVPRINPFTKTPEQIKNLTLRAEAIKFNKEIAGKPLSEWSVDVLKRKYFEFSGLSLGAEKVDQDQVANDARPYNQVILEELERRGVDTRELFLEAVKVLEKKEEKKISLGAAAGEAEEEEKEEVEEELKLSEFRKRVIEHVGLRPNDIREKALLMQEIRNLIGQFPVVEAAGIPHAILELASYFKETRETLINRILFKAFEDSTETNMYGQSMNLYAQSNLDTLLGYLSTQDPDRYAYFVSLRNAAELFHTMNATIIAGNLEEFMRVAERINYQHFSLMQKIPGVSDVMRIYEQKYLDFLARDKRISTKGYQDLKREVEKAMRALNENNLIKSEFINERIKDKPGEMEEWELQRALNIGRTFFNLTFRAAEQIASGQVPRKGSAGEKQFASFPQEAAVRIMNWMQWLNYRFMVAEPRGGLEFLKRTKQAYFDFLQETRSELGINRIKEFGGMNVEELKVGAMFGISGIYSSWRIENMLFPVIKMQIGGETITLRKWLDDNESELDKKIKDGNQDELLVFLKPVIENANVALGVLLKHRMASGEVGYKVRELIWKKVSEKNLPLVINYLTGIKAPGTDIESLETIKQKDSMDWDSDGRWEKLREKIFLQHQKDIKKAIGVDVNDIPNQILNDDERRLINTIKKNGEKLAPHLADIVFPYVPFMNDVPFELLDYGEPGEEFYKRRTGSDFPSYYKAEGAFTQLMNNPGGLGIEESLKLFDAIVKGIESPQGTEDAQKRVYPMFSTWIDFMVTTPGERQAFFKGIKQLLRQPTSLAQSFAGMEADSIDEHQVRQAIDESVKIGILNPELAREMKKKKNVTLLWLIYALFRDYFLTLAISGGYEFGKRLSKAT